jgi:hypothetical protein
MMDSNYSLGNEERGRGENLPDSLKIEISGQRHYLFISGFLINL